MKTTTAIIFVLLFAFVAIANAQTNSTTLDPIAQCIKDKNCGDDLKCRAKCAGVPNPSPKDANDTVTCVSKCNQSDAKAYAACRDNCVNTIYMPTGDQGSGSSPSPSGSSSPSGTESSSKTGSPSSTPSGSANGTKSAAQSLDAKHAFSNNLSMMATLLLVCVVARITSAGF